MKLYDRYCPRTKFPERVNYTRIVFSCTKSCGSNARFRSPPRRVDDTEFATHGSIEVPFLEPIVRSTRSGIVIYRLQTVACHAVADTCSLARTTFYGTSMTILLVSHEIEAYGTIVWKK